MIKATAMGQILISPKLKRDPKYAVISTPFLRQGGGGGGGGGGEDRDVA